MDRIEDAFAAVSRTNFLPEGQRANADLDMPLPIGYGQTNSQPTTVRMMLEWLGARLGDKILDVGSGSGWTSALLSHIVGPKGQIYAVERILELVVFGCENNKRAGTKNIQFYTAGDKYGLPEHAPYDRILVSAGAKYLPEELLEQLKIGGKLVIPVQYNILEIIKNKKEFHKIIKHPGFLFVPLV